MSMGGVKGERTKMMAQTKFSAHHFISDHGDGGETQQQLSYYSLESKRGGSSFPSPLPTPGKGISFLSFPTELSREG